jgi:hypothetical protein
MKPFGPTFFKGNQKKNRSRLQLGKQENNNILGTDFSCWKKRDIGGTRTKTLSMWSPNSDKKLRLSLRRTKLFLAIRAELSFYLESGAYYIQNLGVDTTCTLSFGDQIQAQYSTTICPIGEIPIPQNVPPLLGSVSPTVSGDSATNVGDAQRLCQVYIPASSFTGKLRLFIQALYGSKRKDYSADMSSAYLGGWPLFNFNSGSIKFNGRTSDILVTTEGYEYWLCRLNGDEIDTSGTISLSFYKLVPYSSDVLDLVDFFKNKLIASYTGQENTHGDATQTILETCLLSLLTPHSTAISTTAALSLSVISGQPLEYGWKATWDGKTARIVLITFDPDSWGLEGQDISLSISHSIVGEEDTFSAIASVNEVTGITTQHHLGWIPSGYPFNQSFLNVTFYPCSSDPGSATIIPSPPSTFSGLPIYGWFDKNNIWQDVTLSYDQTPTSDFGTGYSTKVFCYPGVETQISGGSTLLNKYSISVGGDIVTCYTGSTRLPFRTMGLEDLGEQYYTDQLQYLYSGYAICGGADQWGDFTPIGSIAYCTYANAANRYGTVNNSRSLVFFGSIGFVVPFGECEGIFYGSNAYESGGYADITVYPPTENDKPWKFNSLEGRVSGSCSCEGSEAQYCWEGTFLNGISTLSTFTWTGTPNPSYRVYFSTPSYSMKFYYLGKEEDKVVIADGVSSSYGDDIITGDGWPDGLPVPGAPSSGSYQSSLEPFFVAPSNICISGTRDIGLAPWILNSAQYLSTVMKGNGVSIALEDFNTDSYTQNSDTFVGWA